jgi:hypothetical protein
MASTRTRRTSTRATRTGSNALRVQKQINQDYVNLIRDYRKLGVALFRKPMTRYVLGGVAITALVPVFLRMFRNEEVQTFVRDNVEEIRTRIDGVIHSGERELDSLN